MNFLVDAITYEVFEESDSFAYLYGDKCARVVKEEPLTKVITVSEHERQEEVLTLVRTKISWFLDHLDCFEYPSWSEEIVFNCDKYFKKIDG